MGQKVSSDRALADEASEEEAEHETLLPASAASSSNARVKDLETQLANLKRKLDARPIVFQFTGSEGADGAETGWEDEYTEAEDCEMGASEPSAFSRCKRR